MPRASSPAPRARRDRVLGRSPAELRARSGSATSRAGSCARRTRRARRPPRPAESRCRRRSAAPGAASASPASARTSRQGHRLQRRGGLRLVRAAQALLDRDHGPLPGTHVPALGGPADGQGDGRRPLELVGSTTARPPWAAVPLGVLAGRPFEPAKRSPIHARHRELRANIKWAGDWRRPYDYGDPRGRGARRPRVRRPDRRLDARQAARPRAAGGRAARPALPQPRLRPASRARPLRRAHAPRPAGSSTTARSAGSTTTPSTSRRPRAAPARSSSGSRGGSRPGG